MNLPLCPKTFELVQRQDEILTTIKCELEEFPSLVRLHIGTVPSTIGLAKEASRGLHSAASGPHFGS